MNQRRIEIDEIKTFDLVISFCEAKDKGKSEDKDEDKGETSLTRLFS